MEPTLSAETPQPERLTWEKPTVHKISLDVTAGGTAADATQDVVGPPRDYRINS